MLCQLVANMVALMNDIAFLIKLAFSQDEIGNDIESVSRKKVFCQITSASQSEFFKAAQIGFKAEKRIKMWKSEYDGEQIVEIDGKQFNVYRTFENYDYIELYLQTRVANNE